MKRNPWPYAIIGYFVVFISGVVSWIVFAAHHQDQLIRPDYYEHEIRFQQEIDRLARTAALRSSPQIAYHPTDQTIRLSLPTSREATSGTVRLYRPSDAKLDKTIKLELDENGTQAISGAGLQPGLWKVHLSWRAGENEYSLDQPLVIAGDERP